MSDVWLVSYIVLWGLVLALLAIVLVMARLLGLLYHRFPPYGARMTNVGPEVGARLPAFDGLDLRGRPVQIGMEPGTRPTMLAFVSPTCGACGELAPALRSIWRSDRNDLDVYVISVSGDERSVREWVDRHDLRDVPCILAPAWSEASGITSTPYALVLDGANTVVGKGVVNHLEHLESLVKEVEAISGAATPVAVGG
jgi:methylamine dehydrogenase accessory protein MauD